MENPPSADRNPSSSSSSRMSTHKSSPEGSTSRMISKQNVVVAEQPYELETLYGAPDLPYPTRMPAWATRTSRSFARRHPRTHAILSRATLYVRGPRPKVDLPSTEIMPRCCEMSDLWPHSAVPITRYRHQGRQHAHRGAHRNDDHQDDEAADFALAFRHLGRGVHHRLLLLCAGAVVPDAR